MELVVDLPRKHRDTLLADKRHKVLYGGRDGAKSWSIARMALIRGRAKPERILCVREIQKSIADSVHKLLCDQIEALGFQDFYSIQQNYIRGKNGTEFAFHGLSGQTAQSLKSYEGTTICWIEEAQTVTKRSIDILTPTIRAPGSELWWSFNPDMDTDEVYKRFVTNTQPDCISTLVNYTDNPWRSTVLDAEREYMRLNAPDDFNHIYLGQCRPAVEGAIYYNEVSKLRLENRLTIVPYDPLLKVHTIWDLGYNDYMCILLVQKAAGATRIIRYIEDRLRTYDSYVSELNQLRYNWGTDYIPHDGRAKSPESGRSPQMILEALGRRVEIIEDIGVENGIKASRQLFPRVWIDKESAGELLNRLGRYRRRISKETGVAGNPMHDEHSHGADGFRYLSVVEPNLTNDSSGPVGDYYRAWG